MFWKNISLGGNNKNQGVSVFLLEVNVSFKTVAQVSFKDENGNAKIVRFYDKYWSREVSTYTGDPNDVDFKFFAHSPNLKQEENVRLSISLNGEIVLSQNFVLNKDDEFTGWTRLIG
jgi:hypothetical protein